MDSKERVYNFCKTAGMEEGESVFEEAAAKGRKEVEELARNC